MTAPRILIVEDETIVALDLEHRLARLGYESAGTIDTGEQALTQTEQQHPDLVLMDIRLAGAMDGITAAQEIRRRFRTPVIYLTAYSEDGTLQRAKLTEPFGYILKPFEDQELKTTIEMALYKHQAEEEIRRLNRLLGLLSQVNQTIVRCKSREELFPAICQIAITFGQFQAAWLGWHERTAKTLTLLAHAGEAIDLAARRELDSARLLKQADPEAAVFREGKTYVCNDVDQAASSQPKTEPLRPTEIRSFAAVPFSFQGQVCGVFCLYAGEPGFFHTAEIELLEEVARDISFALDALEEGIQRQRAEAALRQNEALLRATLESTADGILVVDFAGKIAGYNERFRTMWRLPADLLATRDDGRALAFVLDQLTDPESFLAEVQRLYVQPEAESFDVLQFKDGRTFERYSMPQRMEGQPVGRVWSFRDVTGRKKAETAIHKSEASLALAQRVAHLGSWEVDLVHDTLEWSDETFRIFGLTPGSCAPTNEKFFSRVHPEDRERVRAAAAGCAATGQPYSIDHRILLPDGTERVVSERAEIILDAHGKALRMVGTVQDVTQLRRAEEALQRNEKHFRSLIENAQDLISIVGLDGIVRFQSPSSQTVLGYTPEQLVGRNALELIHPEDLPLVQAALARAFQEPDRPSTVEYRFRHADGSWRMLESIGRQLSGENPPVVVVNSRDETEHHRLEDQFRQSQKMEAIGQLAGGVAHDFNNLLTVIQGNAALLLDAGDLSEANAAAARQVAEAAERAAGLTRQLLLFGRKQVMHTVSASLNDIVGNMTRMLQRILGEDITLRSEYAPNLPLICADAGMIEQVLLNLAVNSRDAMPKGGRLDIATAAETITEAHLLRNPEARPGLFVCLRVSDAGCGIPPEHLPHIFEPFFTTKEVGQGTGLGLATVHGIVHQHQGWIEVTSEAGRGTIFLVYLPATENASVLPEAPAAPTPLARGVETILVVEDEPGVRDLVVLLLKRCGYTVLPAVSGVAALEVWREHREEIALLLTDIVMPDGMTGHDLAAELQRQKPALKVIYTSGYNDKLPHYGISDEDDRHYLQKPYNPQKLAQVVRECLDEA